MGRLHLRLQRVENLCQRFTSEVRGKSWKPIARCLDVGSSQVEGRQQSELFGARLFAVKVWLPVRCQQNTEWN